MTTIENIDDAGAPEPRPWGPESLSWRQGIDWKTALTTRAVLLLQVAHPVVGAGVADHSDLWVAATGYWAGSAVRRRHGQECAPGVEDALYAEWTDQARVLRIPARVIPADRPAFDS